MSDFMLGVKIVVFYIIPTVLLFIYTDLGLLYSIVLPPIIYLLIEIIAEFVLDFFRYRKL
jgi:cytochrome c oxidase subunit IV